VSEVEGPARTYQLHFRQAKIEDFQSGRRLQV